MSQPNHFGVHVRMCAQSRFTLFRFQTSHQMLLYKPSPLLSRKDEQWPAFWGRNPDGSLQREIVQKRGFLFFFSPLSFFFFQRQPGIYMSAADNQAWASLTTMSVSVKGFSLADDNTHLASPCRPAPTIWGYKALCWPHGGRAARCRGPRKSWASPVTVNSSDYMNLNFYNGWRKWPLETHIHWCWNTILCRRKTRHQ